MRYKMLVFIHIGDSDLHEVIIHPANMVTLKHFTELKDIFLKLFNERDQIVDSRTD